MESQSPENLTPPPQETAPHFSFLFHHEGAFKDSTSITKGFNWGEESTVVINPEATASIKPDFDAAQAVYAEKLPQQDYFPNGLSREQATRVLAAQEAVFRFNGGFPDEHALARNDGLYRGAEDGEVKLSDFKGRGALSCVESSALTQQLLASSEEMIYVSGSADLNNTGEYEMHSFNLIKPADPQHAMAILDIANPIYLRQPDRTFQVKLFCAPVTAEQVDRFKKNDPIEVDYSGEKRKYQFKTPGGTSPVW